ncbi:MAG: hypothetical protein MUC28_03700 [Planctomycetes bacterium]|nr:hypothetical protein [Planctomycetota bacterium]
MQKKSIRKKKMSPQKAIIIKIAVAVLELTALGLIIYLVALKTQNKNTKDTRVNTSKKQNSKNQ